MEIISLLRKGVLRGVFLANHLATSDNLTNNNRETEHIQTQTNVNTKVTIINNNIHIKTYANRKDRQNLVYLFIYLFIYFNPQLDTMQIRTYNSKTLNCKHANCKTSRQSTNRCLHY